jgi:hypothetical protein
MEAVEAEAVEVEAVGVVAVGVVAVGVEALEGRGMTWTAGLREPFYHSRAQLSRRGVGPFRPQRDCLWTDVVWNCCYPGLSVAETLLHFAPSTWRGQPPAPGRRRSAAIVPPQAIVRGASGLGPSQVAPLRLQLALSPEEC